MSRYDEKIKGITSLKIQIITNRDSLESSTGVEVSNFDCPKAFDDFDVNVIDLACEELWQGNFDCNTYYDSDLKAISEMVDEAKTAQIVYVYPQNITYYHHYNNGSYNYEKSMKEIVGENRGRLGICNCFLPHIDEFPIMFEVTKTKVGDKEYDADFHFKGWTGKVLTESMNSKKQTTILRAPNVIFTTLDICDDTADVTSFVENIIRIEHKEELPNWLKNENYFDDTSLKKSIEDNQAVIEKANEEIEKSRRKIQENNHYKSILCSSGEELVNVIFEILEKLLDCDLSSFVDKKREDFLFEKDGKVFIGEIKGINTNVKNANISQLEVHSDNYLDEHEGIDASKIVKLLIINPLRNKPLVEREAIHEEQIARAERNGSLIIETETLLRMFERYVDGLIKTEKCISILVNTKGILRVSDFD